MTSIRCGNCNIKAGTLGKKPKTIICPKCGRVLVK